MVGDWQCVRVWCSVFIHSLDVYVCERVFVCLCLCVHSFLYKHQKIRVETPFDHIEKFTHITSTTWWYYNAFRSTSSKICRIMPRYASISGWNIKMGAKFQHFKVIAVVVSFGMIKSYGRIYFSHSFSHSVLVIEYKGVSEMKQKLVVLTLSGVF